MHQVLIIVGLSDKTELLKKITRKWPKRFGLQPTIYAFGWSGAESTYDKKQAALLVKVDELAKLGEVSVVGTSAGGHKAENLLAERPKQIARAINICGRGRVGNWQGGVVNYPVFRHSLEVLEGQHLDTSKLMTMRPLFDELVPGWTVPVEGATNILLRTIGHAPSIIWALSGRAATIAKFINLR